jgi:hypothetical protein
MSMLKLYVVVCEAEDAGSVAWKMTCFPFVTEVPSRVISYRTKILLGAFTRKLIEGPYSNSTVFEVTRKLK